MQIFHSRNYYFETPKLLVNQKSHIAAVEMCFDVGREQLRSLIIWPMRGKTLQWNADILIFSSNKRRNNHFAAFSPFLCRSSVLNNNDRIQKTLNQYSVYMHGVAVIRLHVFQRKRFLSHRSQKK